MKAGEKQTKLRQEMMDNNMFHLVTKMAFPAVIAVMILSFYNLVDTYFVSFLGSSAVAGVSVVFAGSALLQTVGYTIGMGGASILSTALGGKQKEHGIWCSHVSFYLALLIGLFLLVIGLLFPENIMKWLGATKTSLPYALSYGYYVIWSAPFLILQFVVGNLLRSLGNVKSVMIATIAGGVTNIGMNLVLVRGLRMQMAGAGISFLISQIVILAILLIYWYFSKLPISLKEVIKFQKTELKYIKKIGKMAGTIIKDGMPSLFRQGSASLSIAVINMVAGQYSDDVVSALSIVGKIFLILYSAAIGISQGYQPIAGYLYGAGEKKRIRKAFYVTLLEGTVVMTGLAFVLYFCAHFLVAFFQPAKEVCEIAAKALRMQAFVMPLLMLNNVATMSYQAFKKPLQASVLAVLRQGVCYIPLLYILPQFWGVTGMIAAQPIADGITFLVSLPFSICILRTLRSDCPHGLKHKL